MKKRNELLDIMRGIGIILVVFGHAIVPEIRNNSGVYKNIYEYIYLFHMPLFFFISGYVFEINKNKYNSKKKFLIRKAKLLIIPYLFFSLMSYAVILTCLNLNNIKDILINNGYKVYGIKRTIIQILLCYNNIDKHIWYIYVLFFVFCINIFCKEKGYFCCIMSIGIWIFIQVFHINEYIPATLEQLLKGLMFFTIGRQSNGILEKYINNRLINICNLLTFLFECVYIVNCSEYISHFISVLLRIIVALQGIVLICAISKIISRNKYISNIIKKLNTYTYEIYLLHQPFIVSGISGLMLKYLNLCYFLNIIIVFVIGIILPILIAKLLILSNNKVLLALIGKEKEKKSEKI